MDYYNKAIQRATLNGIDVHGIFPQPAIDVIIFLQKEIDGYRHKIKDLETKKEPAPAATDTSSNIKNEINHLPTNNNNTLLRKCQAELPLIEKDFLTMYEGMTEAEQRAWDLGELFGRIIKLRSEFI